MTGPSGGAQGYKPQGFIANMRSQGFAQSRLEHADGPVELGAVLVTLEGSRATEIKRILDQSLVRENLLERGTRGGLVHQSYFNIKVTKKLKR
jgi:hypothetical protein